MKIDEFKKLVAEAEAESRKAVRGCRNQAEWTARKVIAEVSKEAGEKTEKSEYVVYRKLINAGTKKWSDYRESYEYEYLKGSHETDAHIQWGRSYICKDKIVGWLEA